MRHKDWQVINEIPASPVTVAWTEKNKAAQAIIGLSVEDSFLRLYQWQKRSGKNYT